ncbi:hypothetical protein [Buttiauxella gaviniae]|uniref:hypothetical protein n=1 Tax=Buttiauxella gaviniae TaxID=82990 RepID=UPI0039B08B8A
MSELTLSQAATKSCQLSSLLMTIECLPIEISSVDRENLINLAADMSGEVAVFLMEQEKAQEVRHA